MKRFFTLAAMGALTAASLTASAQFTLDGQATTAEIGTGAGKYQLAASYTGNHLDTDRGLKALYVGYTATTLNILVAGSAEAATSGNYRALMVYINTPNRSGAPAGVQLGGADNQSPLKHRPTLDMQTDYGFRVSVGPGATDVYFSNVSYVTGTGAPTAGTDTYVGSGNKNGTAVTSTATVLPGTRFAYLNTANLSANTGNAGLEIEIPLSAIGGTLLTAGSNLDLFAAYTDGDGGFFTDVIPQIANRTTTLGIDPNFTTIAGNQYLTFVLGSGTLATRSAVAKGLDFQVYPNPATATSTVVYTVPAGRQPVSLAVYNALGQRVRSLAGAEQSGPQQFALGSLPAGAYLVKLQVGEQLTSQKVVVQ
ncbi:T9SS type A sorting domain-containing protein [Hymenobacter convexus]|uniref:T9SS type A sorting domain-containing protein n=1 Tax=Hymenobacter sp. CA1UV-4 TaxID=3063782 RepID=UPI0027138064|nr:T9SS type A sorting domain-containing protein [Hymenobacter sp. CA1UV-4]MDO7851740.1 T9SS type A sorting domain-containing protein [Hymenobacter sp. CA1UV-4]